MVELVLLDELLEEPPPPEFGLEDELEEDESSHDTSKDRTSITTRKR